MKNKEISKSMNYINKNFKSNKMMQLTIKKKKTIKE